MTSLYDTATAVAALQGAWEELLADDRADGALAADTRRFAAEASSRIADLARRSAERSYQPEPLTPVQIRKDDGGTRNLAIPTVSDRIVDKTIAEALTPLIDPVLGPSAYAYRPGLGVTDAPCRRSSGSARKAIPGPSTPTSTTALPTSTAAASGN